MLDNAANEKKRRGLFIAVEGADGAGKSTQLALMKEFFEKNKLPAIFTREPGGTDIGEKIRHIILDPENNEMAAMTEALLYAASRSQHVAQLIEPNVNNGVHVITDRFVDSSLVYQGMARELGQAVETINSLAIMGVEPDFTIFLDLPPDSGKKRIQNGRTKMDRLEMEADEFHCRVYDGYKALIAKQPWKYRVVDGSGSIDQVWKTIEALLMRELGLCGDEFASLPGCTHSGGVNE